METDGAGWTAASSQTISFLNIFYGSTYSYPDCRTYYYGTRNTLKILGFERFKNSKALIELIKKEYHLE